MIATEQRALLIEESGENYKGFMLGVVYRRERNWYVGCYQDPESKKWYECNLPQDTRDEALKCIRQIIDYNIRNNINVFEEKVKR